MNKDKPNLQELIKKNDLKKGDEVVCIDSAENPYFKKGKVYSLSDQGFCLAITLEQGVTHYGDTSKVKFKATNKLFKKRQLILNKSDGLCWYCGCELIKGWHADHFKAIRRNPDGTCSNPENDTEENKVPACPQCNRMKSSMNIEQFRSTVAYFISSLNEYSTQYKFAKKYGLIKETEIKVVFWFEKKFKDAS